MNQYEQDVDKRLLDQIFDIRLKNNVPWRRLMSLALKHAPEEAKAAIREIAENDRKVAQDMWDLSI